jgi:hypothetical protein
LGVAHHHARCMALSAPGCYPTAAHRYLPNEHLGRHTGNADSPALSCVPDNRHLTALPGLDACGRLEAALRWQQTQTMNSSAASRSTTAQPTHEDGTARRGASPVAAEGVGTSAS